MGIGAALVQAPQLTGPTLSAALVSILATGVLAVAIAQARRPCSGRSRGWRWARSRPWRSAAKRLQAIPARRLR